MSDALSPSQFNVERSILEQGNPDQLLTRVRGIQHMTSNVFKPSFSSDYTTVHRVPSPGATGEEEEMDEE
jgi:hypothetical protein